MWRSILMIGTVALCSLALAQPPVEEAQPLIVFPLDGPAQTTAGTDRCDDGSSCADRIAEVCQLFGGRGTSRISADGYCRGACPGMPETVSLICRKPKLKDGEDERVIHDGADPFGMSGCEGIVCEQSQHGGIVSSCADLECAARCWCESCDPEGYCDIGQAFRCLQKC